MAWQDKAEGGKDPQSQQVTEVTDAEAEQAEHEKTKQSEDFR